MYLFSSTQRIVTRLIIWALMILAGIFILFLSGDLLYSSFSRELRPWQTVKLRQEFRAKDAKPNYKFADYMAQEDRLFSEVVTLKKQYFDTKLDSPLSRFNPAGNQLAQRLDRDWNRSYILEAKPERAIALLVHGLSDSPYTLRSIALKLQRDGTTVYGLRLPGHGTTPNGLDQVNWKDWVAAVALAIREIESQNSGKPVYLFGYSTGAALLIHYAAEQVISGRDLSASHKLVLFSPALGITTLAGFANIQRLVTGFGFLQKARWTNIDFEIDPFKYESFAKNAAVQLSNLLGSTYTLLESLSSASLNNKLPPILSFQSAVDESVHAIDLISKLYAVVDNPKSELMFFGVNRSSGIEPFLLFSPQEMLEALKALGKKKFRLALLINESKDSPKLINHFYEAETETPINMQTNLEWPDDIYSLSHVAITCPPDDPVYGYKYQDNQGNRVRTLGDLQMRGERGVLVLSAANQLRLKANPFHSYMLERIARFLNNDNQIVD